MINHIESFDIQTKSVDACSNAYKIASNQLVNFKPTSNEHRQLTKFMAALLKHIKSLRTSTKSLEQHDSDTLAKLESIDAIN